MKEAARKARNSQRLSELYQTFRVRIEKVIADLEGNGIRPRIQDGWRSVADQRMAFDTGHSKLRYGFHNVTAPNGTPEALAADLLDDDSPVSMGKGYFLQLAAAAEAAGLVTGIRWGVPKKLVGAIDAAIAAKDWNANVKVGWDPTHVQPRDVTVAQAKAGTRPP